MIIVVDRETGEVLENCEVINLSESKLKPKSRGATLTVTCNAPGCDNKKEVRRADYNRGWGRYCSKSCAAKGRSK